MRMNGPGALGRAECVWDDGCIVTLTDGYAVYTVSCVVRRVSTMPIILYG